MYFNITQRPVRTIPRLLHPELSPELCPELSKQGWAAGTGGWSTIRLNGSEDDMHCDVDQYYVDEITGDEVFERYLARSAPVLIRGLIDDWPLVKASTRSQLQTMRGDVKVV